MGSLGVTTMCGSHHEHSMGPELSAVTLFECETTTLNKTHQGVLVKTGENHSGHVFKHQRLKDLKKHLESLGSSPGSRLQDHLLVRDVQVKNPTDTRCRY